MNCDCQESGTSCIGNQAEFYLLTGILENALSKAVHGEVFARSKNHQFRVLDAFVRKSSTMD